MDNQEESPEVQPPIGLASLACLACLAIVYLAARRFVTRLEVWWAEWLVYSLVPIAVTSVILYRSCWHRELARGTRILSMILPSCIIFCVDLLVIVAMLVVACLFMGIERFH
jgi:hypothetical protein